jgi:predicted dehydrogenase
MERLEDARVRIVPAHELRYGAPAWLRGRMPRLGAIEAIEARYEMPAMPGTLPLSAVDVGLSGGGVGMELMPDLLDLILFLGGGRPLWVAAKAHRRRMGAQRRQAETGLTAYCPWYFDNLTDPGSVSAATYWGDEVRLEVDVHVTEGSGRLMGRADGLGFVLRAGTVTGSDHPAGVGGGAPLLWTARAASRVLLLRDTGNLLSDRLAGREAAPNRLPTLGPPGQGLALIGEMYRAAATTPPAMLRVTTNTPA